MMKVVIATFILFFLLGCQGTIEDVYTDIKVSVVTAESIGVTEVLYSEIFIDENNGTGIRQIDLITGQTIQETYFDIDSFLTSTLSERKLGGYTVLGHFIAGNGDLETKLFVMDADFEITQRINIETQMNHFMFLNSVVVEEENNFYIFYVGLDGFGDENRDTKPAVFKFDTRAQSQIVVTDGGGSFSQISNLMYTNGRLIFYATTDTDDTFVYGVIDTVTGEMEIVFESESFYHEATVSNGKLMLIQRTGQQSITFIDLDAKESWRATTDTDWIGNVVLTYDGLFLMNAHIGNELKGGHIEIMLTQTGELVFEKENIVDIDDLNAVEIISISDSIKVLVFWTFNLGLDSYRLFEYGEEIIERYWDQLLMLFDEEQLEQEDYQLLHELHNTNLMWILYAYDLVVESFGRHLVFLHIEYSED